MATNGQLLRKLASGQTLLESEIQQLERAMDGYDNYAALVQENSIVGSRALNIQFPFAPIYSTILHEDVSNLGFSIPGNYKHLLIMGHARVNGSGVSAVQIEVQLNGDTGATNYEYNALRNIGTTVTGAEDLTYSGLPLGVVTADTGAASYSGSFFAYIPHYNSNYYKQLIRVMGFFSGAGSQTNITSSLWRSTEKITSILIYPDPTYASAKLEAGSLISVYGIL